MKSKFYTLKGYKLKERNDITESIEDYIEMIYRKVKNKSDITVKEIAIFLNVKASSVSKMANRLKELNLIEFEKYGKIKLNKNGINLGKYLLWRHNILKKFFKLINKKNYNLEQVEKIEHFVDYVTVNNINQLNKKISKTIF